MTVPLFAAWQMLLAVGIDLWEPRFRVRGVYIAATPSDVRLGKAGVRIEVDWRPRALAGDFSVDSVRSFTIRFGTRLQIQ